MPPPLFRIQSSFAGGEFSPSMYARVDIAKYLSGMRTARNVNILPHGGVRNRPGTVMVAAGGNSAKPIRLISFIASTTQAYIIELGDFYARFYTNDAQVQAGGGGAYQIVTPWAAADLNSLVLKQPLKFAQSADVLYFAHPKYPPQQLTFNSDATWTMIPYAFANGPFMLQNTDTTSTITPSAVSGNGITLNATKAIFQAGHVGALFDLEASITAQTITPVLTTSVPNIIPTGTTWSATISGTWNGTILVQTSPDNITWTTVATVSANGTVNGATGFAHGYIRSIMQSSLSFSGSATVAITGIGLSTGPTAIGALNAATAAVPAGDTASITLTSLTGTGDTVLLQRSDDQGATWNTLATYTTNQAATSVATTKTACLIRAKKTIDGGGTPSATVDGTTGAAPTLSVTISPANVSVAIQCGTTWSVITTGGWTGKLRVEVSTDGGANWQLVQTLQSAGTQNYQVSGDTGFSQCLLRVTSDPSLAFSGTATIDLTSDSFQWTGIVQIATFISSTQVTANVLNRSNIDKTGLANTSATYQWSEGSWSSVRGWPTCVVFFQDRLCWGSTLAEPSTMWASKTASYLDFGVSDPIVATDSLSIVLPSRQLNAISNLVVMPQFLVATTTDSEWGIGPGQDGTFSPTSINVQLQGHRGSASIDPVVVGVEIILLQQMGTVLRNLIYQLAVSGFMGDNISIISQHLFTGFQIVQMAYQQEPDSIVWMVRNDGQLLSLTYLREQEVAAFTHHDTAGLFESVAVIPNQTLGINEIWVVVNRTIGGQAVRFIERLMPRDQGTVPANQFFVDCGLTYNGAPATVISGLGYLAGQTVAILADGNVIPQKVVSAAGTITLQIAASVVTVGLPYVSDVETLDIESPDNKGTLQGRRVTISRATLRFWNSRGGYLGPAAPVDQGTGGMFPVIMRERSDGLFTPISLKTADYLQDIDGGYDFGARLFFRQVDPLPFTITGIVAQLVAGEN